MIPAQSLRDLGASWDETCDVSKVQQQPIWQTDMRTILSNG